MKYENGKKVIVHYNSFVLFILCHSSFILTIIKLMHKQFKHLCLTLPKVKHQICTKLEAISWEFWLTNSMICYCEKISKNMITCIIIMCIVL